MINDFIIPRLSKRKPDFVTSSYSARDLVRLFQPVIFFLFNFFFRAHRQPDLGGTARARQLKETKTVRVATSTVIVSVMCRLLLLF